MWKHVFGFAPVTGAILIAAIVVHFSSGLCSLLQVDYGLIADGQWWRIWTGHISHFGGSHLFWDAVMFGLLGAVCERGRSIIYMTVVLMMAAIVTAAIGLGCPGIEIYRGLSGIDTGLFAWFVVAQVRTAIAAEDRQSAFLWSLPLVALVAKLIYEYATATTLFVDSATFRPLVESHLAGAAMGIMAALLTAKSETPEPIVSAV